MRLWAMPLFCLIGASPALASETLGTRGGWDIVRSDKVCAMSMTYDGSGNTNLTFVKSTNGDLVLQVANRNWTAKKEANYEMAYHLNGQVFNRRSSGIVDGPRKGFFATFRPDFEQALAAGSSLRIFMGERLVDNLSLRGTSAALDAMNRCLDTVRARQAAGEPGPPPNDPFAGTATKKPAERPAHRRAPAKKRAPPARASHKG